MDQILEVFCGEEVSSLEAWANQRKVSQDLLSRIFESLSNPRNAYQHIEAIFSLFEKENDEKIQNIIRYALIRVQMYSQFHMFEQSELRDAGDIASLLERVLFGYNLVEGKKPKKEEEPDM